MNSEEITDNNSALHRMKYLQLAEYINNLIATDQLKINDRLPSLNQLIKQLRISKETTLKGLNYLSEKGIIESVYRKGYYVRKKNQYHPYRVCLIMDKMHVLRDTVYYSFLETIKDHADVDVYFHHHNFKVFETLVNENLNNYTHFVIITFLNGDTASILNRIPPQKRIILDYDEKGLEGDYTSIYQDYKLDIEDALHALTSRLKKYKRLVLIAPKEAYHAGLIIEGFEHFCHRAGFSGKVLHNVSAQNFKKGDAYITFSRYDLDDIEIIKLVRKNNWQLGKDIGLLSYNDTAVKEILENGITVISTDFKKMGKEAAKAILSRQPVRVRNQARIISRNSL